MIVRIKHLAANNIWRVYYKNENNRWILRTGQAFYSLESAKQWCKENKLEVQE